MIVLALVTLSRSTSLSVRRQGVLRQVLDKKLPTISIKVAWFTMMDFLVWYMSIIRYPSVPVKLLWKRQGLRNGCGIKPLLKWSITTVITVSSTQRNIAEIASVKGRVKVFQELEPNTLTWTECESNKLELWSLAVKYAAWLHNQRWSRHSGFTPLKFASQNK